jgi:hypothetical protein
MIHARNQYNAASSRSTSNERALSSNLGSATDHVIGGWGLASIFDMQSGVPFIPTTGQIANRDGDTTDRVIVTGPVQNRKGVLTKNFSGANPLVHFAAWSGNAACPFGAGDGIVDPLARMHRGYLRNPGISNWEMQLNKQTNLREKVNMRPKPHELQQSDFQHCQLAVW